MDQQPQHLYELFFASLPDALVMWNREGKILHLNAAALTLFEVQASDLWIEMSSQQFFQHYVWSDEQQQPFFFAPWLLDLETFSESHVAHSYEQTLLLGLPSKHKVLLELHCAVVRDASQQPLGMLAVFHEVAPRYQKALHIQRVYEALLTLNAAISRLPEQFPVTFSNESVLFSPPVLLVGQQLVDIIHEVLACWRVSLLASSSSTFHFSYVVGSGFTTEQEHQRRELSGRFLFADFVDETMLARLRANQEIILSSDRLCIPAGHQNDFGNANLLGMPLFLEQNLAGVLLIHKHEWERAYSQEEIDLVRAVAVHFLLFIDLLGCLQKQMGTQARNRVLPEVDRLSQDFLTLASHELRTPLTGIKGNLQLAQRRLERLKDDMLQQSKSMNAHLADTQRSLKSAEQSTLLQERMVQDIIDAAQIQVNQLDLSMKPCDLLALLKEVVTKQQASMLERKVELEILTPEPTIPVLADAERIIQVINIYLVNALHASPAKRPVTVWVQQENQRVRVSVHDEGVGIPPEEQRLLWDRFYRGKGSAVQHELDLSLGLGFYLCRALIERHHGAVGVQSTPGQGTTFWLTLPMTKRAEA